MGSLVLLAAHCESLRFDGILIVLVARFTTALLQTLAVWYLYMCVLRSTSAWQ